MATMTFLAVCDGDFTYQGADGGGTLDHVGITFAPGSVSGHQAASVTNGPTLQLSLTSPGSVLVSPLIGAMAIRFRRDVDAGSATTNNQNLLILGSANSQTKDSLALRIDGPSNTLQAFSRIDLQALQIAQSTVNPLGVWSIGYADWTSTSIRAAQGSATPVSVARTMPYWQLATPSYLQIGEAQGSHAVQGLIDGVAIWDQPLSDAERAVVTGNASVWTWQMQAPNLAGHVDVLPSLGANATAPTLVLP